MSAVACGFRTVKEVWIDVATGSLAFLLSYVCVWAIIRASKRLSLLDFPTWRSSHLVPTPRGGGAGAITAILIVIVAAADAGGLTWRVSLALFAVIPTALVGWIDDRGSAPISTRLAAHISSGVLLLPVALADIHPPIFVIALGLGWVILTVSAINVLNFMDGIDGIIALQTIILGFHYALLSPDDALPRIIGLAMCGGAGGFLIWNWPPARIFLGDVGSGAFGVLGILGGVMLSKEGVPFLHIFLPVFPLCLDAALTILRRWKRSEKMTEAHRSHLYQHLANGTWGHAKVSLAYAFSAAVGSLLAITLRGQAFLIAAIIYGILVIALELGLYSAYSAVIGVQRDDGPWFGRDE